MNKINGAYLISLLRIAMEAIKDDTSFSKSELEQINKFTNALASVCDDLLCHVPDNVVKRDVIALTDILKGGSEND